MNLDLLFAIIFYGLLLIFFFAKREKFQVQAKIFALYKTKIGLNLMDKISKISPRFLNFLGILSIITGFVGMIFIFYWLLKGTIDLLLVPNAVPAVAPVLPGIKVLPGLPILSFWHWIIAIFFVAIVHEFSHGIFARLYNTKIKSSGFAFLGPILAAFVEPDEKQLAKKSKKAQLSVFSVGPFSNIIFGLIFMLILSYISAPIYASVYTENGIVVNKFITGYPAEKSGLKVPFIIKGVNNIETLSLKSFLNITKDINPGDKIILNTNQGDFKIKTVENPENKTKAFVGISEFGIDTKIKENIALKYGTFIPKTIAWTNLLIFWLFAVNIGVGLFNLLPLGPIDGGRMFYTALFYFTDNPNKVKKVWSLVTFFILLLIFINLVPYLWKLLLFILKPFNSIV